MNLNNTKMESQFIPYEQALDLKKLGFDEECFAVYSEYDKTRVYDESFIKEGLKIQAPLWQQAFDWFRNKNDMFGCIDLQTVNPAHWYCRIDVVKINDYIYHSEDDNLAFETYEEARLACLEKLIEICKEKKS